MWLIHADSPGSIPFNPLIPFTCKRGTFEDPQTHLFQVVLLKDLEMCVLVGGLNPLKNVKVS